MERLIKSELFTKNSNMQVEENHENENPAKKTVNHALDLLALENWQIWLSPKNVYFDLFEVLPFEI